MWEQKANLESILATFKELLLLRLKLDWVPNDHAVFQVRWDHLGRQAHFFPI